MLLVFFGFEEDDCGIIIEEDEEEALLSFGGIVIIIGDEAEEVPLLAISIPAKGSEGSRDTFPSFITVFFVGIDEVAMKSNPDDAKGSAAIFDDEAKDEEEFNAARGSILLTEDDADNGGAANGSRVVVEAADVWRGGGGLTLSFGGPVRVLPEPEFRFDCIPEGWGFGDELCLVLNPKGSALCVVVLKVDAAPTTAVGAGGNTQEGCGSLVLGIEFIGGAGGSIPPTEAK
mmetsp:Transcript_3044/g.4232  ORF Transcript_3044/g.4232 Transcript_3044/m.4232 type:complete len:231 (+) Transcript_3044:163-855(+)|eukprot:CAMPEP_0197328274 /NCGR_PEP_ID=MMETSP0892-20130614/4299_1 /TAXON_ID=44058 ORGANISM="Aureoumbra lagunensis, Strain CCMP1510" /NCGR_SAMPLE_ID=MMETSP0892 /ASSEMBLY_ACC=CAM_ASM_000538 /LENGTH=230 /DNA_ID=CAMNT_0042824009 /DNA_START=69 /DNA_END=761 /DNA_ORIENTATION=-